MPIIKWNPEKETWLKKVRHVSFEDIAHKLETGDIIKIRKHFNPRKYPHQHLIYYLNDNYVYIAPCIIKDGEIFLKTSYPSRKETKKLIRSK